MRTQFVLRSPPIDDDHYDYLTWFICCWLFEGVLRISNKQLLRLIDMSARLVSLSLSGCACCKSTTTVPSLLVVGRFVILFGG